MPMIRKPERKWWCIRRFMDGLNFGCAPLSMFMEPVDREKYPEASQQYRFERVCPQGSDSQGAGGQKANGKKANDQEGYDLETAESGDGLQPVNPFLLDFFDAMDEKDYDRMLEYLARDGGKDYAEGAG